MRVHNPLTIPIILLLGQLISCSPDPGMDGVDGMTSLVNVTKEAAGANCATGGFRIDTGLDKNSDSTLAQNEIQNTVYICNGITGATGPQGPSGTNGLTSLITTTAQPIDNTCSGIRYKIETGLDSNGDGTLSTNEIESTIYICSADINYGKQTIVLSGDVTDEEAAKLIAADLGTSTQEVKIVSCTNLTTVDLSGLERAISIQINDNKILKNVNLSGLKTMVGDFHVSSSPELETLNLESLQDVFLEDFYGVFSISETKIATLNIPLLRKIIGGSVSISYNQFLKSVSLPLLSLSKTTVGLGGLSIYGPNLETINLDQLIEGSVINVGNDNLETVTLSSLSSVESLTINGKMTSLLLPELSNGFISINSNEMETIDLSNLMTGGIGIAGGKITTLSLPKFVEGDIYINSNSSLTNVTVPSLTSGAVSFENNSNLTLVSFPNLENASQINFSHNSSLTSMSFPKLSSTPGTLISNSGIPGIYINNNSALSTINLPMLTNSTEGQLVISGNDNLVSVTLPLLSKISGFEVGNNENLTVITLPQLVSWSTSTNNSNSATFFAASNKLSSNSANSLLSNIVQITPVVTGRSIYLQQLPVAPPTGQGVTDKNTLVANGNTVITD